MKRGLLTVLALILVCCFALPNPVQAAEVTDLEILIRQLPEVSDPLGTEYYFYDQLSDVEKVMYWKMTEATWENPEITISGVGTYTQEELESFAQRALTALVSDSPEYHMYWNRYARGKLSGSEYSYTLDKNPVASAYLIKKAEARIDEIVATVGQEGDVYSRVRDLLELMARETDYDHSIYLIGDTNISRKTQFNDCILGTLTNDIAVCGGYADTVKALCDRLRIPCIVVGNAGHAWNFVLMDDGQWYSVDATADCPFDYFVDEYNLIGSQSTNYASNYIYHLSELYLGKMGDFAFPELAKTEYRYDKKYTALLHDVENLFDVGSPKFVYTVNDDYTTCTIITYEGPQTGSLIIPDSIDGYTVTAIGESAFFAMDFTGDLIIADSVTSIEDGAFQHCEKLAGKLKLSAQTENIGMLAFFECTGLKDALNLPASLQVLGSYAFSYSKGFSGDLILPEEIELGAGVFSYCSGLNGVLYLPDNMTWDANQVIGTNLQAIVVNDSNANYSAYDGILYTKDMTNLLACPGGKIGDIVIPEGVETISDSAFRECKKINGTLTLPNTLKEIGDKAFLLTGGFVGDLLIPDSVTAIGVSAFSSAGFDGILSLPDNLTRIESHAFSSCSFVGDLIIPDSVTCIGEYAFLYCPFGGVLSLPNSLESIGSGAFSAGSSSGAYFSSAIDLAGTNVQIAEDAFWYRVFPEFECNCGAELIEDPWNNRFVLCSNCMGGVAHMHNWIDATCTAPKTCSVCGETEGEELGHDMGDWVVIKEATCTEDGELERDCSRCEHFETEVIESVGHSWADATCEAPKTCSVCGESEGEELGHDLSDWVVTKDPTTVEEGEKFRSCLRDLCDYTETEKIPVIGQVDAWVQEDSKWYYYENGEMLKSEWLKSGGAWYYLDAEGVMVTGWEKIDGKHYCFSAGGAMQTGWQKVDGKWYYLNSEMKTGWTKVSGKWYYLGTDGAMQTGWQKVDGKWYYLNSEMKTGWTKVSGKWYYLGTDGAMQTGWQKIDGKWYYLKSDMKTGWVQVGSKWYYMDAKGVMQTGWEKVDSKWYYLGTDGAMKTGWQKISSKWYYLGTNGAMQTGWVKLSGKWYYLDDSGVMVTGTQTIDGKTYNFNSSGVWIG